MVSTGALDPFGEPRQPPLEAGLLAEIARRSPEVASARALPDDLADRLRDAGLFALGAPRAEGGGELPPPELLQVVEALAMADASTAWTVMIATAGDLLASRLGDEGRAEVYAGGPHTFVGGSFHGAGEATRVGGGHRLTGRWSLSSAARRSEWFTLNATTVDGAAGFAAFAVPVADVTIDRTWTATGLAGTDSQTVVVDGAIVPDRLTFDPLRPGARPEPLYQLPCVGLLAAQVAAVTLGTASGAVAEATSVAARKVPAGGATPLLQQGHALRTVGRAEARLASARLGLAHAAGAWWDAATRGEAVPVPARAALRLAAAHAVETAVGVTGEVHRLAGSDAIAPSSTLERRLADVSAAALHAMVAPLVYEVGARALHLPGGEEATAL